MGFSFRNLFPEKEGGETGQASQPFGSQLPDQREGNGGNSAMPSQGTSAVGGNAPLFGNAQPTDRGSFEQMFAGGRPDEAASGAGPVPNGFAGGTAPGWSATYLAGELLQFIPPALASPDAVPMEQPVHVNLPADGSRDVKLSALYLGCPQLFATEITPLNDSQVTLPEPGQGVGGAGPAPGMIPEMGTSVPTNPFGNSSLVEDQNQRNASPAAAAAPAPNPFDPGATTGEPSAFDAGAAPQAATPAPTSWQQEVPEELAPQPRQEAVEQQAPFTNEAELGAAIAPQVEREQLTTEGPPFAQVENSAFGSAPVNAPESAPFPAPSPMEAPSAGGDFSVEQSFDPQASLAGQSSIPPFPAPTESPFPAAPENPAPAFAPAPEQQQPTSAGELPPQESPFGGGGGGDDGGAADIGFVDSPFDVDDDNPFFLADDEDDEPEQNGHDLLGAVQDFDAADSASPFEADALPTPTAAPESPSDLMGALEPATPSAATSAEPAMPWPAAVTEPKNEAPSFGGAFSGGSDVPTPGAESTFVVEKPTAEVVEPNPDSAPAPGAASIFGAPSFGEDPPAVAETGTELSPAPPAAETLATAFAAAVATDAAPSLLPPSPFEAGASTSATTAAPGFVPATEGVSEAAAVTEPEAVAATASAHGSDTTLEFVLRDLLFPHRTEALGFSVESLPYELMARVPLKRIEPQLASGRVTVSLGDLAVAVDPPHGQTLAQGNQSLEIELPPTALFHQLERVSESKASAAAVAEKVESLAPAEMETAPAGEPGREESVADFIAPAASEEQNENDLPLPPAGASSGFATPFSDLAREDEESAEPAQETRFAAQRASEDPSGKVQMRFGKYSSPSIDDGGDSEAAGESSPPPLPALQRDNGAQAPVANGKIWSSQIPGPLSKGRTAFDQEPGSEPVAGSEPTIEEPTEPSRSINISLGPGAVTADSVEKKLAPLAGSAAGDQAGAEAAGEVGQLNDDQEDRPMHATREEKKSPAGAARDLESKRDQDSAAVDRQADDGDDTTESMIFTSSRPDHESAQESKSKEPSSMAEDSLDTLPTFADLMAREAGAKSDGDGAGEAAEVVADSGAEEQQPGEQFGEGEADFFAELEPPPFSFQPELPPEARHESAGISNSALGGDEFRDLELRAIFGTTEEFTLQRVAELTLDLCSTIDSCALLTHGRAVDVSRRHGVADDREAHRRAQQARAMHRNLRDLADNAGLTQAQALTLHTDREAISFFQRGDVCLTVRHDRSGFPAGVREKLMLVAHGVAASTERR